MMENTSFYINLAKQFTTEPDNIAMLAMTFYSRDFDIRNGNGNGNGKEIENEIEKLRTKMQIEQKECYYKRSLSVFSQRYVLEGFFQDVLMQVRDSQLLLDLIGATTFPKNKLTNLTNCSHPTMLFVNELLLIREVREAIWQGMGIKAVVEVPRFPTYLIYGLVSLNLVYPPADAVYISDLMDPKLADFLKFLAERSRLPVDVYDEMAASAGEDLVADLRNPVAISELSDVASLSIPDGSQKDSKSANV